MNNYIPLFYMYVVKYPGFNPDVSLVTRCYQKGPLVCHTHKKSVKWKALLKSLEQNFIDAEKLYRKIRR